MTVNIARQQLRLVSSLHASVFTFLALKFAPPSPQGMQLVSTDRIGQDEALKNVQTAPLNILFELHGLAHEMSISVMWNCNLKKKNTIPFPQDTDTFPCSQKVATSSLQQNSSSTSCSWTPKALLSAESNHLFHGSKSRPSYTEQGRRMTYACDEIQS